MTASLIPTEPTLRARQAAAGNHAMKTAWCSQLVDFEAGNTDYDLLTVPAGHIFLMDTFEVVCVAGTAVTNAADVHCGSTADPIELVPDTQLEAVAPTFRHVFDDPQNSIEAGITIVGGVGTTASTATTHTGYFIITGYLLKL